MKLLLGALRCFSSRRLTVLLVVFWTCLLAAARFLEPAFGAEWVNWHIIQSGWYVGVILALVGNVVASTVAAKPWRWRHPTLAAIPLGVAVLLAAQAQSALLRVEGTLMLRKGETTSTILVTRRSELVLLSKRGAEARSYELGFSPGPADWPSGKSLDFGSVDDIGVKISSFYRHAQFESGWVLDELGFSDPAIQVRLPAAGGQSEQTHTEQTRWYTPVLFGSPPETGEIDVVIQRVDAATLRQDFLETPTLDPNHNGVLAVHVDGQRVLLDVDQSLGKKVPVGEHGLEVEILEYLPNAVSSKGKFSTRGDEPKNPMLLLQLHTPDRDTTVSEIAYANKPFITLATIKKQEALAEFWFHHPKAVVGTGVEFMQSSDGKLHYRAGANGVRQSQGEAQPGQSIKIDPQREITLLQYLPSARKDAIVSSVTATRDPAVIVADHEAAIQLELTIDGRTERFWLGRNDARVGVRNIATPTGPLVILFGYEQAPLGFQLKLNEIRTESKSPDARDASNVCEVTLSPDLKQGTASFAEVTRPVTRHRPLEFQGAKVRERVVRPLPGGVDLAVFDVQLDPARYTHFVGYGLIGVGVLAAIYLRSKPRAAGASETR